MPVAIGPNTTKPYIMLEDRELAPEKQTRFHIRILTYRDMISLQSKTESISDESESAEAKQTGSQQLSTVVKNFIDILSMTIHSWENYRDETGVEIPQGNYDRFSFGQLRELVTAAVSAQRLTEEEAKN